MFKDKKTIAILFLSFALVVVCFIAFKPEPKPYDKELIEKRVKQLQRENSQLTDEIAAELRKTRKFSKQIDSLEHIKSKIQIIYVDKSKEIDGASVGNVVNDLNHVFSDNGIK